jgi:N4-(beta-N-acetylglucosaminyl)-L-asparaginase
LENKSYFILHLFQILNLLNYGKPQKFFKTTALASAAFALQSFKGTRETEDIAKPKKINKPIVLQLEFRYASECGCLGCFKNNGKALDAVEAGVKFRS